MPVADLARWPAWPRSASAFGGMVHGLTLGFGTTLIGEAVDYSIYLFVQSAQYTCAAGATNGPGSARSGPRCGWAF
ncbi:hypothetical protein ACU4GD_10890 [Cupriavidus basilensis]